MLKTRTFVAIGLVAGALGWSPLAGRPIVHAAIPDPIRIENGLVSGVSGAVPEVRVFKGIPFAAPPVGDLRWRAPEPAKNWDGVRAADRFSANYMQRAAGGGTFPPYGGDRSATT